MYNLMQLSYFFKNTPYLRVVLPIQIPDSNSFNQMLKDGIKELFIIIPNVNGLVIHLSNLKFNNSIKTLNDVLSVCDTKDFLVFGPENLYLETNGVQILDNNGILLFKQDVEKYLYDTERDTINEVVHEKLNDIAVCVRFAESQDRTRRSNKIATSVDSLVKNSGNPGQSDCKSCVDHMVGINSTTKRNRLNRSNSPFRNRVGG